MENPKTLESTIAKEEARPARVRPPGSSASFLGTGLVLLIAGSALAAIGSSMNSGYSDDGMPLIVIGGIAVLIGTIVLAMGVYYAASNLDTVAAVRFNDELRTLRAARRAEKAAAAAVEPPGAGT